MKRFLSKDRVVHELATMPKVKQTAVENFLWTVGNNKNKIDALLNLGRDARIYGWNEETVNAIIYGINQYFK